MSALGGDGRFITEAVRSSAPVATNKDAAATASNNPETIKARKKRSMPENVSDADPVPAS